VGLRDSLSLGQALTATRWRRLLIVFAGVILPQVVMYGPSLTGWRILLPLDTVAEALPPAADWKSPREVDYTLSDQTYVYEPWRRFAVDEVRAGRWPLWNPYIYCGAPFIAANQSAVFSPLRAMDYLFPGTTVLAWSQLVKSLLAGVGAFLCLRRVVRVSFWPAALGAWCWPLVGFMFIWQGFPLSVVCAWLPWALWATDRAVREPAGWGGVGLALVTASMLLAGHADSAGHALLASGVLFLWRMGTLYGWRGLASRRALGSLAAVLLGWGLGFGLSMLQTLPTLEYLQMSHRIANRAAREASIFTTGLGSSPLIVLPYVYGFKPSEGFFVWPCGNWLESPASAYAGLILTLGLAPLAWSLEERRRENWFWLLLGLGALVPVLQIPGLNRVFSVLPLKLLANQRLGFVFAFCAVALAVTGWEALLKGRARWRYGCWLGLAATLALGVWSVRSSMNLPPVIAQALAAYLPNKVELHFHRSWFKQTLWNSALVCAIGVVGLAIIWSHTEEAKRLWKRRPRHWHAISLLALAGLMLGELWWNGWGITKQYDPSWYYAETPVIRELRERTAKTGERICGFASSLPVNLNQMFQLSDVRGYDAVDPQAMMDLLRAAAKADRSGGLHEVEYAVTLYFMPQESPILDMLGVRYRLLPAGARTDQKPLLHGQRRDVYLNEKALPRAFVPRSVEQKKAEEIVAALAEPQFDPAAVAYVAEEVGLPAGPYRGGARLREALPTRVTLDLQMETAGLVVLSDLYFPGWQAHLNGSEVPIWRTNHAVRGVVVPAGKSELVFEYWPQSFVWGLWLTGGGLLALAVWSFAVWKGQRG
jgi:hypothetical protein